MAVRRRHLGQAMVEAALVIPLLMLLAFGGIAVGRLVQSRMALDAVAREAARATVLSPMPTVSDRDGRDARDDAIQNGRHAADQAAAGFGLHDVTVDIDSHRDRAGEPDFGPGAWVTADADYTVRITDLPFMRQVFQSVLSGQGIQLHSHHVERIDPFRSRQP